MNADAFNGVRLGVCVTHCAGFLKLFAVILARLHGSI